MITIILPNIVKCRFFHWISNLWICSTLLSQLIFSHNSTSWPTSISKQFTDFVTFFYKTRLTFDNLQLQEFLFYSCLVLDLLYCSKFIDFFKTMFQTTLIGSK